MTTALTIIQAAYREGNLIPVGTSPNAAEQSEALDRLNAFMLGIYGYEMGEQLIDWLVPAPQRTAAVAANFPQLPYPTDIGGDIWPLPNAADLSSAIYLYPPRNSRIIFGGTVSRAIWFPEAPDDGSRMAIVQGGGVADGLVATLDGNGRKIDGNAQTTVTTPFTPQQWLYRADLGEWRLVAAMALADEMPFPVDFDDFFVAGLAIRLAPRYGVEPRTGTALTFSDSLKRLKTRYRQSGTTVYGAQDFPRSLQSYIAGRWWY